MAVVILCFDSEIAWQDHPTSLTVGLAWLTPASLENVLTLGLEALNHGQAVPAL